MNPTDTQTNDGGWRPISEAPKDGTYILLLSPSGYVTTPHRVNVGAWIPGFRNAWVDHANDRITDGGEPPTHWQPLPAPPK